MDLQYSVTVPAALVYGITAARLDFNASIPQTVDGPVDAAGQPTQVPNPDLIASDAAYMITRNGDLANSYARQHAPVAPPVQLPPVQVNGVPQVVSMRQAQIALSRANLLTTVESAIAGMPGAAGIEARITWAKSATVERGASLIAALAAGLNLTPEQIDALFVTADAIPA